MIKDYIGKRFGHLLVLERVGDLNHRARVLCQCDCGNTKVVDAYNLSSGNTRSCGCMQKAGLRKMLNLAGRRFGKLTVLERNYSHPKGAVWWNCRCDCGNIAERATNYLLRHDKHNGCDVCCPPPPKHFYRTRKDLTGQKFGRLTVLERCYDLDICKRSSATYWKCQCDCGNICYISSANLVRQKSCGCLKRENAVRMNKIRYHRA